MEQVIKWVDVDWKELPNIELEAGDYIAFQKSNSEYSLDSYSSFKVLENQQKMWQNCNFSLVTKIAKIA